MGQYWVVVNLDKKEFVHPHKLGTGMKLWEQVANHPGTGTALLILTAAMPEPRGGGDLALNERSEKVIGRWAGDRVAIVGDYAEDSDLPVEFEASTIYNRCLSSEGEFSYKYTDISKLVVAVIEDELELKCDDRGGWAQWVSRVADKTK